MMVTKFNYSLIALVTAADHALINQAIKATADPVGGEVNFTNGASSDGNEPATHYYASSRITKDGLGDVKGLSLLYPDSKVWVWVVDLYGSQKILNDVFSGISNVALSETTLNQVLLDEGLQRVEIQI